ncbi:hypothetical protein G5714_006311 [Onychostoma macrolepis]|uniref:Uncharacterized protein n=1 Tax=Onychostoma macrolepis TaxID=369639 RepID=A0A7J6D3H1_9TELE|nr:hypothetical protein G5714_006311 [Onychostoma macrolepis]
MLSKKFLHPEGGSIVRCQLPLHCKEDEEQDARKDHLQSCSLIRFDRGTSYLFNGWCFTHNRDKPMIAESDRWPGLFTVPEVEAEFLRITTVPIVTKFFAQLDHHADQLIRVLKKTVGSKGKKINLTFALTAQNETVEKKRECLLRALCIYLNEDTSSLFRVSGFRWLCCPEGP